eukprot:gene4958-6175_t
MTLFGGRTFKEGLFLISKWKFVKGDKVEIISGRDKGKQGIIKTINRKHNNVIVEGLKLIKKQTPSTKNNRSQTYTKEAPIHYSNILHVDPNTSKPTKVRFQLIDGVRERVSKLSSAIIPKPELKTFKKWRKDNLDGPLDTSPELARLKTYDGVIDSIDPRPTI